MTPLKFEKYGGNGGEVTIMAERITHWERFSLCGRSGTDIHLDTGTTISVATQYEYVGKMVAEASKE